MEYLVKKRELKKEDIEYIEIVFDNGDCLPISKTEILDISTRLYDKLILGKDYWNSFCAVVESGFLKLRLQKQAKGAYAYPHVYNQREYNRDRINYIKNRLCNEGGITCIKLFDGNNWHFTLYCQVETTSDSDCLTLEFVPKYKKGEYKSDTHSILLPEIGKTIVRNVQLDFENCEELKIEQEEILEMQLNLNKELCWCSRNYVRQIESGFIKIKINEENNEHREDGFMGEWPKGKKGTNKIIKRLCGKKGFDLHDLCHLYIEYDYTDAGFYKRECVEMNDLRSKEEFEAIEKLEEREGHEFVPYYLGGYAEKIDKDIVLITFGKTALNDVKTN